MSGRFYPLFLKRRLRSLCSAIQSAYLLVFPVLILEVNPAVASVVEQSFELHPGWNAIFLEVVPEESNPAAALAVAATA